ncbi:MAG: sulfur carrier protein ThiS adenylyltransferase ThiF [Butyrivibrio sp.]|nr:sulfur carrier protein ThiS adenylyltransferase ThiF [Butyrivibrio sp.]
MISREELDRAFDSRFNKEMQEKLRNARVAVAGLGGLGSNIAVALSRSGVGHMLLVDFDTVDTTNLNRQAYGITQLGKPKTEAIMEVLAEINPYLDIETRLTKVTKENAADIFEGFPIVCEAFDKADQKAMLVSTLLEKTSDTVIISGNGMAGVGSCNDIKTTHKMKRLYICGDGKTDVDDGIGLMAPRVMVAAGHQAGQVIRLILGLD